MTEPFNFDPHKYLPVINDSLSKYVPNINLYGSKLSESMRYSLLNSGKRLRPLLTLEFCNSCGGDLQKAIPFACAVEMIHTASLILDDLPCMDNDNLRRGQPSNHMVFGETTAILAANTLFFRAFEVMLKENNFNNYKLIVKSAYEMAYYSGMNGMIAGQAMDIEFEKSNPDIDAILEMYDKKTVAIIVAACKMGCIISDANDSQIEAAENYAKALGLAFQISDDILDITSDEKTLGKPINSDVNNKKTTYLSLNGLSASKKKISELTKIAVTSLEAFNGNITYLRDLALFLETRKN